MRSGRLVSVRRPVNAPYVAKRVTDLADGGLRAQRLAQRVQQVPGALRGGLEVDRSGAVNSRRRPGAARSRASRAACSGSIAGSTGSGSYGSSPSETNLFTPTTTRSPASICRATW